MNKIVDVMVPVRNELSTTKYFVDQMREQVGWRYCWIWDNGSDDGTAKYLEKLPSRDDRFKVVDADGFRFYEMWDRGLNVARENGADLLGIFNNDLIMVKDTIKLLAETFDKEPNTWISFPDYEWRESDGLSRVKGLYERRWGTYRHGGMSGYCFMVDVHRLNWSPLIDSGYELWYGDDDLAFEVEKRGGYQVRVMGLPLDHVGQVTSKNHPELQSLISKDREHFVSRWRKWILEKHKYDEGMV